MPAKKKESKSDSNRPVDDDDVDNGAVLWSSLEVKLVKKIFKCFNTKGRFFSVKGKVVVRQMRGKKEKNYTPQSTK